jgi:hypothetical protein
MNADKRRWIDEEKANKWIAAIQRRAVYSPLIPYGQRYRTPKIEIDD